MKIIIARAAQSAVIFVAIGMQTSNVCADDNSMIFFDEMDTVMISSRTAELVTFLESVVMVEKKGNRSVRRYFDSYGTPFYTEDDELIKQFPKERVL